MSATIYVSPTGSNSNSGMVDNPLLTIGYALSSRVNAGDTIYIMSGVYNEPLALGNSGSGAAPILVTNYSGDFVEVVAASNQNLLRSRGAKSWYEFRGLRFVGGYNTSYPSGQPYTIDMGDGAWVGTSAPSISSVGGGCAYTFTSCYIEGNVRLYGCSNLVQMCHLYGRNQFGNGVFDSYQYSHDNRCISNIIHGYLYRGIWSMTMTYGDLFQGNTVYNIISGQGINIDGATHACAKSVIEFNLISYCGAQGIQLENGSGCIARNNVIYNCRDGIMAYNYGLEYADGEYRLVDTSNLIYNNIMWNLTRQGLGAWQSRGNKFCNNTVFNILSSTLGYGGAITLTRNYSGYYANNTEIKNNIFMNSLYGLFIDDGEGSTSSMTGLDMDNNIYYGITSGQIVRYNRLSQNYTLANFQATFDQDTSSVFANPVFVNASAGNFYVEQGSPAVDKGLTMNIGYTTDITGITRPNGTAWDIGAYEFVFGVTTQTQGVFPLRAPVNLTWLYGTAISGLQFPLTTLSGTYALYYGSGALSSVISRDGGPWQATTYTISGIPGDGVYTLAALSDTEMQCLVWYLKISSASGCTDYAIQGFNMSGIALRTDVSALKGTLAACSTIVEAVSNVHGAQILAATSGLKVDVSGMRGIMTAVSGLRNDVSGLPGILTAVSSVRIAVSGLPGILAATSGLKNDVSGLPGILTAISGVPGNIPGSNLSAFAEQVWNTITATYTSSTTFGGALIDKTDDILTAVSAIPGNIPGSNVSSFAERVWNTLVSSNTSSATFGGHLATLINQNLIATSGTASAAVAGNVPYFNDILAAVSGAAGATKDVLISDITTLTSGTIGHTLRLIRWALWENLVVDKRYTPNRLYLKNSATATSAYFELSDTSNSTTKTRGG